MSDFRHSYSFELRDCVFESLTFSKSRGLVRFKRMRPKYPSAVTHKYGYQFVGKVIKNILNTKEIIHREILEIRLTAGILYLDVQNYLNLTNLLNSENGRPPNTKSRSSKEYEF